MTNVTGSSAPSSPAPSSPAPSSPDRWAPRPGTRWQWQLTGQPDLTVDVPVYDLDGADTAATTIDRLHEKGRRAICYVSVGSFEDWRTDAGAFPDAVLGRSNGWPGERWLDIRRLDVLAPILQARLDLCQQKGFDAVEPDNVDGYTNDTGFPLTPEDQLAFNRWVAAEVHERGMSVGLKNDLDQVAELVDDFDFAVNEQCAEFDECHRLEPFIDQGKAVLHVEYDVATTAFCRSVPRGFSSMLKRIELDAWRQPCPA